MSRREKNESWPGGGEKSGRPMGVASDRATGQSGAGPLGMHRTGCKCAQHRCPPLACTEPLPTLLSEPSPSGAAASAPRTKCRPSASASGATLPTLFHPLLCCRPIMLLTIAIPWGLSQIPRCGTAAGQLCFRRIMQRCQVDDSCRRSNIHLGDKCLDSRGLAVCMYDRSIS